MSAYASNVGEHTSNNLENPPRAACDSSPSAQFAFSATMLSMAKTPGRVV